MDFTETVEDYEDQIVDLLGFVVEEIVDRIVENSEELTEPQIIQLTQEVYKKVHEG